MQCLDWQLHFCGSALNLIWHSRNVTYLYEPDLKWIFTIFFVQEARPLWITFQYLASFLWGQGEVVQTYTWAIFGSWIRKNCSVTIHYFFEVSCDMFSWESVKVPMKQKIIAAFLKRFSESRRMALGFQISSVTRFQFPCPVIMRKDR